MSFFSIDRRPSTTDPNDQISQLETEANTLINTLTEELLTEAYSLQKFSTPKSVSSIGDIESLVFGSTDSSKPGIQFTHDETFSLKFTNEQIGQFNHSIQEASKKISVPKKSALITPLALIHQHIIKPLTISWVIKPKLQKLQALHVVKNGLNELRCQAPTSTSNSTKETSIKNKLQTILSVVTNMIHAHSTPSPFSTYHEAGKGRTGEFMNKAFVFVNNLDEKELSSDQNTVELERMNRP